MEIIVVKCYHHGNWKLINCTLKLNLSRGQLSTANGFLSPGPS